jgi:hypothetical protein
MAETSPVQKFANFKQAYCGRRRIRPEAFAGSVFFKTLHRFRLPLAIPFWIVNRAMFAIDLETIRSVGAATSKQEVSVILEEFHNYNRLERGKRRGGMGIRVSGIRLFDLFEKYEPYITAPTVANPLEGLSHSIIGTGVRQVESNAVVLRKLRQAHNSIVNGQPVPESAREIGMTEDEFLAALAANRSGNPALVWLHDQLERNRRLEKADQEISSLHRTIAGQGREIVSLRERHEPKAVLPSTSHAA